MRPPTGRSLIVALSTLICATAAAVTVWLPVTAVGTEDQNRDGRPDLWRSHDRFGQVARIAVDTNFDGRSDVQEFYEGGALVRREWDRDFNDRVDLIQEFDPTTRQVVRSVSDVNADGVADLLQLFDEGEPVYSKSAQRVTPVAFNASRSRAAPRTRDEPLAPLEDPFSRDRAVKPIRVATIDTEPLGPSTSVAAPKASRAGTNLPRSTDSLPSSVGHLSAAHVSSSSPRGPPSLQFPS